MARFVRPEYSKRQIERAGKILGERIPADGLTPEVQEAFRIAHNWREACAYPMHSVRGELSYQVKKGGDSGITVGRLKRMASIRRKLFARNRTLYQIQDIAGVRAILPNMREVERVSAHFTSGETRHGVIRTDDYIAAPKQDGYRSRHFILKFTGVGEAEIYNRNFVEVQVRTRMQHAWATAVEAVGLMRGENLKAGIGSPDWLRFFALMSGEIALREGQPISDALEEDRDERLKELRDLERRLDALKHLDGYKSAIRYVGELAMAGRRYFLISFNRQSGSVIVSPFSEFWRGASAYNAGEDISSSNVVLVEADRANDLREAYPNYFADVTAFLAECRAALSGSGPTQTDLGDFSWLTTWRRPRGPRLR